MVACAGLGRRHFRHVDGLVLRTAYGPNHCSSAPLALPIPFKSPDKRNTSLHTQNRSLHGIFCFLRLALSRSSRGSKRLALDMGFGRAFYRGRIFGVGRNSSSVRSQPHCFSLGFLARFGRCIRCFCGDLSLVPLPKSPLLASALATCTIPRRCYAQLSLLFSLTLT